MVSFIASLQLDRDGIFTHPEKEYLFRRRQALDTSKERNFRLCFQVDIIFTKKIGTQKQCQTLLFVAKQEHSQHLNIFQSLFYPLHLILRMNFFSYKLLSEMQKFRLCFLLPFRYFHLFRRNFMLSMEIKL